MTLKQGNIESLTLPGEAGAIEALLNLGATDAIYAALVCHPHPLFGGTMHNKVVFAAAKVLNSFGFPVLRFNFRGVGMSAGEHDEGRGEVADARVGLDYLAERFALPILFAGYSFGAAVGMRAAVEDPRVAGLVLIGAPVQVEERRYSYEPLQASAIPKLFVSGTNDQFATQDQLQAIFASASKPKKLVMIPETDHFFAGKLEAVREALRGWVREVTGMAAAGGSNGGGSGSRDPQSAHSWRAGEEMRGAAREIFAHAREESGIARAFRRKVYYERGILQVGDDLFDLGGFCRIFVVAIGKAAHSSLEALVSQLGTGVQATGIVSAPTQPSAQVSGFRYYEGGHPLPNEESLRAAEAILRGLESLTEDAFAIYLISGGGSAVAEKPLHEEIAFEELIESYRVLVHSGAPIAEINALRKHLSAVKGGRMAVAAAPAQQLSILVSDVPDNALDSLASGPTMPDSSTAEQCYEIVQHYELLPQLPRNMRELFEQRRLEETPKSDDPAFVRARWWTILSNASAVQAAAEHAEKLGFAVEIDNRCDEWDYRKAGDYLLQRLRELRNRSPANASRVCLISGGELSVKVDRTPGVGGRNQQFALYCAQQIRGEQICVLSAGTDGIDGNSPAAGAVVDGSTIARAQEKGLSAQAALANFDAYPFFQALGDAIVTGPSGTNVRDLRVLLAW